jgi:hypothetical protein
MVARARLNIREIEGMFHNFYCENSCICLACSFAFLAVETCSKAILALFAGHGKSPCFLRCDFLRVLSVDDVLLVFASVHVDDFLECAF